jgi:hypothetical protein
VWRNASELLESVEVTVAAPIDCWDAVRASGQVVRLLDVPPVLGVRRIALRGSDSAVESESSVYHCLSSCPEYAHGELPCTVFNCPFPVVSGALRIPSAFGRREAL